MNCLFLCLAISLLHPFSFWSLGVCLRKLRKISRDCPSDTSCNSHPSLGSCGPQPLPRPALPWHGLILPGPVKTPLSKACPASSNLYLPFCHIWHNRAFRKVVVFMFSASFRAGLSCLPASCVPRECGSPLHQRGRHTANVQINAC